MPGDIGGGRGYQLAAERRRRIDEENDELLALAAAILPFITRR